LEVVLVQFSGCQFGPLGLRRVLRRRFAPGEHLVGWAVLMHEPRLHEVLFSAGLMVIPVAHGFAHSATAGLRRFVVLSDRRVIVFGTGKKAIDTRGGGILGECSIGDLELRRVKRGEYRLRVPGVARRFIAKLPIKADGGAGRLARALEAMSAS
jgi:hypothetical protein